MSGLIELLAPFLALAWPILPLTWPNDPPDRRYGRRTLLLGLAALALVALLRGAFGSTPIHPKSDGVLAWRVAAGLAHVVGLAAGAAVAAARSAQTRSLDAWTWLGIAAAATALGSLAAPVVGWPGGIPVGLMAPIESLVLAGAAAWPVAALAAPAPGARGAAGRKALAGVAAIAGVVGAAVAFTRPYGGGLLGDRSALLAFHAAGVVTAGYLWALPAVARDPRAGAPGTVLTLTSLLLALSGVGFGFLLFVSLAIPW